MAQNIEKNKLSLSNLTLTSDSFSRRRTMMMMEEICPNPPSPTRQQQQQQQQQRSRLPTPSVPSRRQSLVNASVPRYGSISISTSSNTTTDTQIPHPHPPRPRPSHHGSFTEGAGQSECLNQDGRYPLVPTRPRKRISEVNQQQHTAEWGLVNNNNSNSARPLPRSHTMGNMTSGNSSSIRRFMGSTSSSAARVGYRDRGGSRGNHLVTTTTMPGDRHRGLSGHEEGKGVAPEKKDDRPTIRQVSSVDVGASTVYSSALTEGIAGNVNTHSPPVTRYRVIRGLPEEFSAATAGVAVSTTPSPNHGDYSFAASDDTIGLALTASVPPSGDSSYESARETSELVNFSRPKRFSFASETQIPLLANHGTENQKTKIEDRTLSEMNDENSDNPMITTAQSTWYWLGYLTALSDRFRTEALAPHSPTTSFTLSGVDADSMHDEERRIRRAFMHLHLLCATQRAKDSLEEFRVRYMEKSGGVISFVGQEKKVKEKRGVLEKLMGRKGGVGK